jgi:hypothetical protein
MNTLSEMSIVCCHGTVDQLCYYNLAYLISPILHILGVKGGEELETMARVRGVRGPSNPKKKRFLRHHIKL